MDSPPSSSSTPRIAWILIVVLAGAQLAACLFGSLRADDWANLERGQQVFSSQGRDIWTTLNPFTLYRPLVDVWHGVMLRLFGLDPRPMLALLVGQLLLQAWLLSRLVRSLGGTRESGALAALALFAQVNTYSWTTLWVSNATGSLMTTFALIALNAWVYAVRDHMRDRTPLIGIGGMTLALIASALCKEEAVLLPGIAIALAATRWRNASAHEQRGWVLATGALVAVAASYALFRTQLLPTPQVGATRYHLRLGPHMLRNIAFFAVHLGALPVMVTLLARWRLPAAFTREARELPGWDATRDAVLGGLAWTVVACTIYLPISGRPAYGYLYAPALGIAFAAGHALAFAAVAQARLGAPRSAVTPLAAHALVAMLLTAGGLAANGWHRFSSIQRDALETLRREVPNPSPGAFFVFLDPEPRETLSGRSLFSLVFDGTTASLLRLNYARPDLHSNVVRAVRSDPSMLPPGAIVFTTRQGILARESASP